MYANLQTGEIPLGDGLAITPALTKTAFLDSVIGARANLFTDAPWPDTYSLTIASAEMGYLLSFEGEKLVRVIASSERPEFGTGWDDWSAAKEKARFHAHGQWLKMTGLTAGNYDWGSVDSVLEVRFGCSSIVINYN